MTAEKNINIDRWTGIGSHIIFSMSGHMLLHGIVQEKEQRAVSVYDKVLKIHDAAGLKDPQL